MARTFDNNAANFLDCGDPAELTLDRSFTLAGWAYKTADREQALVSHGAGDWYFRFDSSAKLHFLESQVASILISTNTLASDAWHHCAVTIGAGGTATVTIYANGVSDGSTTTTRTLNDGLVSLTLGVDQNALGVKSEPFQGRIAEWGIWSAALNASEIAALARGVSPRRVRPESLEAYWPLYGLHSPEPDFSGQANPATINGTLAQSNHAPVTPFTWFRNAVFDAVQPILLTPTTAVATWAGNTPTKVLGGLTRTPTTAVATWAANTPTKVLGGLLLTPVTAVVTWSGLAASLLERVGDGLLWLLRRRRRNSRGCH